MVIWIKENEIIIWMDTELFIVIRHQFNCLLLTSIIKIFSKQMSTDKRFSLLQGSLRITHLQKVQNKLAYANVYINTHARCEKNFRKI